MTAPASLSILQVAPQTIIQKHTLLQKEMSFWEEHKTPACLLFDAALYK
jgi:hypothetical protein